MNSNATKVLSAILLFSVVVCSHIAADNYTIKVKTGCRDNAGTDANVWVQLLGAIRNSPELKLDNPGIDDNEKCDLCTFHVSYGQPVGWINSIRLRHDNSNHKPGWFVEYVTVTNDRVGLSFRADFNRWLATDEGDHRIDVSMPVPVAPAILASGNIETTFMGWEVSRLNNQLPTPIEDYSMTFSHQFTSGVSLAKETCINADSRSGIEASFLGLVGCNFTESVSNIVTQELRTTVARTDTKTTEFHINVLPNTSFTVLSIYFQNVLKGIATTNGASILYKDFETMMEPDLIMLDGILSQEECEAAVRDYLVAILGSDSGLATTVSNQYQFVVRRTALPGRIDRKAVDEAQRHIPVPKLPPDLLRRIRGAKTFMPE